MKELRVVRQLLRLVDEKKGAELKFVFLNEIFTSLGKAKKKIDRQAFIYEMLKEKTREKVHDLKKYLEELEFKK